MVDGAKIKDLPLKKKPKILLIGTPEDLIALSQAAVGAGPVSDDMQEEEGPEGPTSLQDDPDVQAKLQRRLQSVQVTVLNPPREGKKCAVFDIDHTLFALGASGERPEELARPFMHQLLAGMYPDWDIVIWSATSAKWVELKMRELGVLSHPDYRIVCLLDYRAMLTVETEQYGVFNCKPLAFLWAKLPQYNERNTIIVDDLRRNFVMNPGNGLKVTPYRGRGQQDDMLMHLLEYTKLLSPLDDVRNLDNKKWESALAKRRR